MWEGRAGALARRPRAARGVPRKGHGAAVHIAEAARAREREAQVKWVLRVLPLGQS